MKTLWSLMRKPKSSGHPQIPVLRHLGVLILSTAIAAGLLQWIYLYGNFHRWHNPIFFGGVIAITGVMLHWAYYQRALRAKAAQG